VGGLRAAHSLLGGRIDGAVLPAIPAEFREISAGPAIIARQNLPGGAGAAVLIADLCR